VTVYYRFHPLSGGRFACLGCRKVREQRLFIIRHPDGSRMHLPEWVCQPDAGLLKIRGTPRICLRALDDLRDLIAPFLLVPDTIGTGGHDEGNTAQTVTRRAVPSGATAKPSDEGPTGGPDPTSVQDHRSCDDKRASGIGQPDHTGGRS